MTNEEIKKELKEVRKAKEFADFLGISYGALRSRLKKEGNYYSLNEQYKKFKRKIRWKQ